VTASETKSSEVTTSTETDKQDAEQAPEVVRLSVNLAPDVAEALKRLANKSGVTLTEMVRRAISTENFLEEQRAAGKKVLIADEEEKNVREVVFR
jgi:predicted transcriptional regulator